MLSIATRGPSGKQAGLFCSMTEPSSNSGASIKELTFEGLVGSRTSSSAGPQSRGSRGPGDRGDEQLSERQHPRPSQVAIEESYEDHYYEDPDGIDGADAKGHMAILAQEHATEQSLALLAKKAKHATKAMQLYSKSIEKEVEQLLQASASLCHDRSGTSSQQVDNLRLDIETWSSRLHLAMQEIKAITSAIEDQDLAGLPLPPEEIHEDTSPLETET